MARNPKMATTKAFNPWRPPTSPSKPHEVIEKQEEIATVKVWSDSNVEVPIGCTHISVFTVSGCKDEITFWKHTSFPNLNYASEMKAYNKALKKFNKDAVEWRIEEAKYLESKKTDEFKGKLVQYHALEKELKSKGLIK